MLIHRLALRLGKTLDELQNSVDEEELHRWMVFDAIEPIGDRRHDVTSSYICASQAGGKPSDYIPQWDHWIGDAEQMPDDDRPVPDAQTLEKIQEERNALAFKMMMFRLMKARGGEVPDNAFGDDPVAPEPPASH